MEFIQVLISSSLLPPSLSSLTSFALSPVSLVSSDLFRFPSQEHRATQPLQESLFFAPLCLEAPPDGALGVGWRHVPQSLFLYRAQVEPPLWRQVDGFPH